MQMFKYTNEEIKKFEKAITLVIKEFDSLFKESGLDKIFFTVNLEGIENYDKGYMNKDWFFVIDDYGVYFNQSLGSNYKKIFFAKRNRFGKNKMQFPINLCDLIFLREYENIKAMVVSEVNAALRQRNISIEVADKICKNAESIVEIDMPRSQNVHEVEVSEENGKKIGVINFGSQIVKIITNGDIVLVNKDSNSNAKKKGRKS